jgi:ABC-type multidrug transport system fused ATPase/permease subunit
MASTTFVIQAPFWWSWWFLTFLLLIFAGIIWFIYRYYRMKKLMEMEQMRVRIASDLHDDVGSALTEIALQSDFLQEYDELDAENLKDTLQQIGNQSRKIVSSLDDIVWSIDARNDTVGDLTDRMQDYVNNVLPGRKPQSERDTVTDADRKHFELIERATPLRRRCTPREVATVVRFLVSGEASFVNGEVIQVDGGLSNAQVGSIVRSPEGDYEELLDDE